MGSVVLITGVSRFIGRRLAALLSEDPDIERVIGVDTVAPPREDDTALGRTEFVRADIRTPLISDVIAQSRANIVVHAGLVMAGDAVGVPASNPITGAVRGSRSVGKELNVIGTMQLLAACQKSDTVERFVLRSTGAVYGAGAKYPAVLGEETQARHGALRGYAKDAAEAEDAVRAFTRRRPDVCTSVLRMAPIIGPGVSTAFCRWLSAPVVPAPLGYDPRLQLLHEADAVEALRLAAISQRPGVVNVAAEGVMTLTQLVRQTCRIRLPVAGAAMAAVGAALQNPAAGLVAAHEPNLVRHGRVLDTRRLHDHFGFRPTMSTQEAADSLPAVVNPARHWRQRLLDVGSDVLAARRVGGAVGAQGA